ncbi:hypothetical protein EJB05_20620, partial [Eragrostis curvula]
MGRPFVNGSAAIPASSCPSTWSRTQECLAVPEMSCNFLSQDCQSLEIYSVLGLDSVFEQSMKQEHNAMGRGFIWARAPQLRSQRTLISKKKEKNVTKNILAKERLGLFYKLSILGLSAGLLSQATYTTVHLGSFR